ncbi:MAG: ATP-binding protein [Myxococcales bacterium]|nr:ATP-binding protein [Myxococcales bacterium]
MAIYWLEFRSALSETWASPWHLIGERMAASFTSPMLPMTALFAGLGTLVGAVYAAADARLRRSERAVSHLEAEMARDVPTLIRQGESERVEFKTSARWDARQGKVNKALGDVVARTVCAFANHEGGSLLVGVDDGGEVVGLERDYRTLKSPDRDGFAQLVMTLVRERLGGHVCRLVHVVFADLGGADVCRIVVEPADAPVYFSDGKQARLVVRTGNASRELDAREAVAYVAATWSGRGRRRPR